MELLLYSLYLFVSIIVPFHFPFWWSWLPWCRPGLVLLFHSSSWGIWKRTNFLYLFIILFVQVIYSDEEKKFNIEIIFGLIRSELLNLGEYNVHLAKLIDGGRNSMLRYKIFLSFLFILILYLCPFITKSYWMVSKFIGDICCYMYT
jgi:hypothetical protein